MARYPLTLLSQGTLLLLGMLISEAASSSQRGPRPAGGPDDAVDRAAAEFRLLAKTTPSGASSVAAAEWSAAGVAEWRRALRRGELPGDSAPVGAGRSSVGDQAMWPGEPLLSAFKSACAELGLPALTRSYPALSDAVLRSLAQEAERYRQEEEQAGEEEQAPWEDEPGQTSNGERGEGQPGGGNTEASDESEGSAPGGSDEGESDNSEGESDGSEEEESDETSASVKSGEGGGDAGGSGEGEGDGEGDGANADAEGVGAEAAGEEVIGKANTGKVDTGAAKNAAKNAAAAADRLRERWQAPADGVRQIEKALGKVPEDMLPTNLFEEGQEGGKESEDAEEGDGEGSPGGGKGSLKGSSGAWGYSGWTELAATQERVETMPELLRFMATVGRRPALAGKRKAKLPVVRETKPPAAEGVVFIEHAPPSDASGLRVSDDVGRMLPSEFSLLAAGPRARKLFFSRIAEKRLMSYALRGFSATPATPPRPEERRRQSTPLQEGHGPLLICLDTSGSMNGEPEALAKAVVLAAARVAAKEGRGCRVISFGGAGEAEDSGEFLGDGESGLFRLLYFLASSFNGGTDVTPALSRCLDLIEEASDVAAAGAASAGLWGSIGEASGSVTGRATGVGRRRTDWAAVTAESFETVTSSAAATKPTTFTSRQPKAMASTFAAADLIIVTDGELGSPPSDVDTMKRLERVRTTLGTRVHTLLICNGSPPYKTQTSTMETLSGDGTDGGGVRDFLCRHLARNQRSAITDTGDYTNDPGWGGGGAPTWRSPRAAGRSGSITMRLRGGMLRSTSRPARLSHEPPPPSPVKPSVRSPPLLSWRLPCARRAARLARGC
mmetsp:Transcript_9189/g.23306  ORF Transcript_9189/g.23306 Transcript_9189/m.23306 type:complete len:840 (+) Transcript_9189:170-2689(+)